MKMPLTHTTRGAATVLIDAECKMVAVGAPPHIGNDLAEIARRVNAFDAMADAADGLYDTVQDLRHVINGVLAGDGLDDTLDDVMVRGKKRILAYRAAVALAKGEAE